MFMTELIWHVLMHAVTDTLRLVPFLFLTYLVMEYLEHKTQKTTQEMIRKAGKLGPLIGGIAGVFPQCGFSAAASSFYAGGVISVGTLMAVFLSTSDEMLPIFISESVELPVILKILGVKILIGAVSGFVLDILWRAGSRKRKEYHEHRHIHKEHHEKDIHDLCEHEHCHCEEEGIFKSALKHALHIFVFIFIVTLVINTIIYFIGEENLSHLILNVPVLGPMIAGVVGLIPNCAGSVILTQLFLEGVITFGSMMGGLLVGSGIGILILYRTNKNIKENIRITALLYVIGTVLGILIDVLGFPIL